MAALVHTIGHSTRRLEDFLALLLDHGLTAVADVRSRPYSRMNPQFNREPLAKALVEHGIAYVFLGGELGARTDNPDCYVDGKVEYDRLARTNSFQEGLTRIEHDTLRHNVVLMCAEKEPLVCHRSILVARHLVRRGVQIRHILDAKMTEDHDTSMGRLLSLLRMDGADMFRTRDELMELAYQKQGMKIAFSRDEADETRRRKFA